MAKVYTPEEKQAKLKQIVELRKQGTPLLEALKKAGVPVGTHYSWTRRSPKAKTRKQRVAVTPQLVQIPQAVEPDKIIVLVGTPRNIGIMLERFL